MKRVYLINAQLGLGRPLCLRGLADHFLSLLHLPSAPSLPVPAASALSALSQFISIGTSALLEQGVSSSLCSPPDMAGLADIPKLLSIPRPFPVLLDKVFRQPASFLSPVNSSLYSFAALHILYSLSCTLLTT